MEIVERTVLDHLEPLDCPLILVSQIPRSGGTLLSQLFDGHPQIYGFHAQFHAIKKRWPSLPEQATLREKFAEFYDTRHLRMFLEGYKRGANTETKLFLLPPSLQERIFVKLLEENGGASERDIFNAYMTSYFQGWLNNRQTPEGKKYISAFTARMATNEHLVKKFFEVYGDGYLIQSLRHPVSWFASYASMLDWGTAKRSSKIEAAIKEWRDSTQAIIRNRSEYGDRVIAFRFENLIRDAETTMRQISTKIGVDFNQCLTTPTFNKRPFGSNTYFGKPASGRVDSAVAERKPRLLDEEVAYIEKIALDDYNNALAYISLSDLGQP